MARKKVNFTIATQEELLNYIETFQTNVCEVKTFVDKDTGYVIFVEKDARIGEIEENN